MNILHLISSGGFYGAERVVVELAGYTQSQGHKVAVLVIDSPGAKAVISALSMRDITCELVSAGRLGLPGVCLRLRKYIQENTIDIVHSHGYRTDVLACLAGLLTPVKRIATCHTWYSTTAKLIIYEKIDKLVLRLFDHVVAVSPQLVQEIADAGVAARKTTLVFNGIDIDGSYTREESSSLRKQYGIKQSSKVLLRIGRLDRDKGNSTLLNAFTREFKERDAFLIFVGDGEDQSRLVIQAGKLSIGEQVIFSGYQQNVGKFLSMADLFVISSYKEGLPIALLEAMAYGKAVVATDVGAIGKVIEHKINGWLVQPMDVGCLSHALREIAADVVLANRLGAEARKSYMKNHGLESMGRGYLDIYSRLDQQG